MKYSECTVCGRPLQIEPKKLRRIINDGYETQTRIDSNGKETKVKVKIESYTEIACASCWEHILKTAPEEIRIEYVNMVHQIDDGIKITQYKPRNYVSNLCAVDPRSVDRKLPKKIGAALNRISFT